MILLTHETRILLSVAPADFRNYAPTNFMRCMYAVELHTGNTLAHLQRIKI